MRIGNLNVGRDQLQEAGETLERAWKETGESWQDANSRVIESEHLEPLFQEMSKMLNAIQKLNDVFAKAQRECEPS